MAPAYLFLSVFHISFALFKQIDMSMHDGKMKGKNGRKEERKEGERERKKWKIEEYKASKISLREHLLLS